jgi:hypothetical protein
MTTDDDCRAGRTVVDLQVIGTVAHKQRSPSSIVPGWQAASPWVTDRSHHLWSLELHMDGHDATVGSVGVVDDVGAGFTDSDEHIVDDARCCAGCGQPAAQRI